MANFLAPIINDQQENSNGAPLSGGLVEVYLAGSSTAATTFSDQAGLNPNTWPIVLNTLGVNGQGAVWLGGGFSYKFVVKDSAGVVQRTIDNVAGINDNTGSIDQWVPFQGAPTYVSATSFTVGGDQTPTLQVGRRLKSINTGGTVYSTIISSVYGAPNTTVTVRNDSGVLDSGISQVSYGLISSLDSSLPPGRMTGPRVFTSSVTYTATPGTKAVQIELYGSGGGGGGAPITGAAAQAAGGGGGAGGYGRLYLTSGFTGIPLVIGNAGVGVFGADGTAGADSSIGGMVVNGGSGGGVGITRTAANYSGAPGGGGAGTGANLGTPGQAGTTGTVFAGGGISGTGGHAPWGSGGPGSVADSTIAASGNNGLGYGSGGGGAIAVNSGSAPKGGDGAKGVCYIWEYA